MVNTCRCKYVWLCGTPVITLLTFFYIHFDKLIKAHMNNMASIRSFFVALFAQTYTQEQIPQRRHITTITFHPHRTAPHLTLTCAHAYPTHIFILKTIEPFEIICHQQDAKKYGGFRYFFSPNHYIYPFFVDDDDDDDALV